MTGRDVVRGRRRRRVGPLTFAAIGLTLAGAVAGVWSASAGYASPGDPRLLLQCEGTHIVETEVLYSAGGAKVANVATPETIVDRWAATAMVGQGTVNKASPAKRTHFRSSDHAQISVLTGAGKVNAVVTMAHTPESGWYVEVTHECA